MTANSDGGADDASKGGGSANLNNGTEESNEDASN
jgi:hypothetical protein